jgi:putative ABC transport system substrate-binding protein
MSLKGVGILIASALVLVSAPPASGAQQVAKVPRVGIVWIATAATVAPFHEAFRQGLRDLGYVEGQTIALETKFAEGVEDRLPALMAELVRVKADVIVAPSTPAVRAARKATGTIPIVMANVADPVGLGFVSSLAQPGGNITGLSNLTVELGAKTMELLKEALPRLSRLSTLVDPAHPAAELFTREAKAAANTLHLELQVLEGKDPGGFERAYAEAAKNRAGAMLVGTAEGLFSQHRRRLCDLALRHRLPMAVSGAPYYAEAGALMAYGSKPTAILHRAATYVDKILKGAKPADLPVEQPTRFELIINMKTAKALGLTVPPSVLIRADQVIQ